MPKVLPTYPRLRGHMAANGWKMTDIADAIGRGVRYVSQRMSGEESWELDEVYEICDLFDIPYGDIPVFFPPKDLRGGKKR